MVKVQNRLILSSALALLALAGSVSAAPELRDLGHGWQVLIPDADVIDIVVDEAASNSTTLVIEKFATFMSLDALDLVFTQIAPNAQTATRIVLTDEYIGNQSGSTWVAFTNSLINQANGSTAFNPALSAGLSISPFTTTTYEAGNTSVTFGGGSIPHAGYWFPGVTSGALVADVILNPDNSPNARTTFTLREVPLVPTPGATVLGIAAVGFIAARRRRA